MTRQTRARIWALLREVMDRVEGDHSGIPECCVEVFVQGRQAAAFRAGLSEADRERSEVYKYVPCDECFEAGRVSQLRWNGHTGISKDLLRIMDEIDRMVE